jgi:hypothetical protein
MEQIVHNATLLHPGLDFAAFNAASWRIPDRFLGNRHCCALHGVGMADGRPQVPTHPAFANADGGRL